jgi:hypothetical protein
MLFKGTDIYWDGNYNREKTGKLRVERVEGTSDWKLLNYRHAFREPNCPMPPTDKIFPQNFATARTAHHYKHTDDKGRHYEGTIRLAVLKNHKGPALYPIIRLDWPLVRRDHPSRGAFLALYPAMYPIQRPDARSQHGKEMRSNWDPKKSPNFDEHARERTAWKITEQNRSGVNLCKSANTSLDNLQGPSFSPRNGDPATTGSRTRGQPQPRKDNKRRSKKHSFTTSSRQASPPAASSSTKSPSSSRSSKSSTSSSYHRPPGQGPSAPASGKRRNVVIQKKPRPRRRKVVTKARRRQNKDDRRGNDDWTDPGKRPVRKRKKGARSPESNSPAS